MTAIVVLRPGQSLVTLRTLAAMKCKYTRQFSVPCRSSAAMILCISLVGAASRAGDAPPGATATAEHGMVVTVSPPASDVGLEVLRQGGTAVDAAVAVALALEVTFPEAGNIGGGGFMLVWPGRGAKPVCVDYRETAPGVATPDMFAKDRAPHSHKAVGVPGTLRGLELAHKTWGKRPWRELFAPAVRLAEEGFAIDAALAAELNKMVANRTIGEEFRRVYGRADGRPWQAGDQLVQPDLAVTLKRVADEGADSFYRGAIAQQLIAEMQAGGGLIAADDLAGYQARLREPIHGTYRGYDIYGPPPPSSGGTCIVEMLNILENFDLRSEGRWSPRTAHLMIEAMRRAYCDRARYLGDPDFVEIPARLTTKDYARELVAGIDRAKPTPSKDLVPDVQLADEGSSTTHFSIVDRDRMAVANTYTLQEGFGSRIVVRGAGFLLNNEMTDFNARPGHTDRGGAIGTPANTIAPGKRMLSSQSPTLVARDGELRLVTGSPGGRTIPNTVLCVLVNVLDFDMDARAAVDAPRMHHQWLPDRVRIERDDDADTGPLERQLQTLGHEVFVARPEQGDAHTILLRGKMLEGAADLRQSVGKAAGY